MTLKITNAGEQIMRTPQPGWPRTIPLMQLGRGTAWNKVFAHNSFPKHRQAIPFPPSGTRSDARYLASHLFCAIINKVVGRNENVRTKSLRLTEQAALWLNVTKRLKKRVIAVGLAVEHGKSVKKSLFYSVVSVLSGTFKKNPCFKL
jgi:hypothetical protein